MVRSQLYLLSHLLLLILIPYNNIILATLLYQYRDLPSNTTLPCPHTVRHTCPSLLPPPTTRVCSSSIHKRLPLCKPPSENTIKTSFLPIPDPTPQTFWHHGKACVGSWRREGPANHRLGKQDQQHAGRVHIKLRESDCVHPGRSWRCWSSKYRNSIEACAVLQQHASCLGKHSREVHSPQHHNAERSEIKASSRKDRTRAAGQKRGRLGCVLLPRIGWRRWHRLYLVS